MKKAIKKTVLEYPAVFSPAEEGGYNVSFPDFPGCVTFGDNLKEAEAMAADALGLWIEQLKADNESLPPQRQHPIIRDIEISVTS